MLNLFKLTFLYLISLSNATYNYSLIQEVLFRISNANVSEACRASLLKVEQYFSRYDSIPQQRSFFYDSFGVGNTEQIVSNSRFMHRMMRCIKSAAEKEYSVSEHPVQYCYGSSSKIFRGTTFTVCMPLPCDDDRVKILNEWKMESSPSSSNSSLDAVVCIESRRRVQWHQKLVPWLILSYIWVSWIVVTFATAYDWERGEKSTSSLAKELFVAFSMKKSATMLYALPKNRSSIITCLFGMRFFMLVWIMIGHVFESIQPFIENIDDFKSDIVNGFSNQWITNFWLAVDTFFVIGGTVNAYGWFRSVGKSEEKPKWNSCGYWLRFYRHRLVRLWPAYASALATIFFISNVYYHAVWPPVDPAVQCPTSAWQNLLLIDSLFESRCTAWTWYISTDFMFYLASPIFFLTYLKSKRAGVVLCVIVIALSAFLRALAMLLYNMPPARLLWSNSAIFNADANQHFTQMYIKPQYRIGPYIVGILVGQYLAENQERPQNFSTVFIALGYCVSAVFGCFSVFGLYPILKGWNWPLYYVVYGSLHRTLFGVAIAWIIFACHTGAGGPINMFLSLRLFVPLSALAYSVYLLNVPMILARFLELPFPYPYTSKTATLLAFVPVFFSSYALGLQCSLISEFPAINLERLLLKRRRQK